MFLVSNFQILSQFFAKIFIVVVCTIGNVTSECADEFVQRVSRLFRLFNRQSFERDFFNLEPFRFGFFDDGLINTFGNF
jgi:hypothetical protein